VKVSSATHFLAAAPDLSPQIDPNFKAAAASGLVFGSSKTLGHAARVGLQAAARGHNVNHPSRNEARGRTNELL